MKPRRARNAGMTLVEAMVCIVLLGITATGISALYATGLQTLEDSDDRMLMDSRLRGQLEELIAQPVADLLATGSGTVLAPIGSTTRTLSWTAVPHDLDGDKAPEEGAAFVTVTLEERSLSVVLVDHGARVGKVN